MPVQMISCLIKQRMDEIQTGSMAPEQSSDARDCVFAAFCTAREYRAPIINMLWF